MKIKSVFYLLFLFINSNIYTQTTDNIISISENILKDLLGDSIFYNYCAYDTNSYYSYLNIFNKEKYEDLKINQKLKKRSYDYDARWNVVIPYPKCPVFDTIKGNVTIYLSKSKELKYKVNLDFIPDFYWKNEECNLITEEEAISIAKKAVEIKEDDIVTTEIIFDRKKQEFFWEVNKLLWKEDVVVKFIEREHGEIKIIRINAKSKEVKSIHVASFMTGPI